MEPSKEYHQGVKRKLSAPVILNITAHNVTKSQWMSDHTPTPTRFIRNCEEVGLFQDLQNVNPFDEDFRNALKDTSSSTKLLIDGEPLTNNDDTLHTPNILPHITTAQALLDCSECQNEVTNQDQCFSDDGSEFELRIESDKDSEDLNPTNPDQQNESPTENPSNNNVSSPSNDVNKPLTEEKLEEICDIIGVPKDGFKKSTTISKANDETSSKEISDNAAFRRAYNRLAQLKSRQRHKEGMARVNVELSKLRYENERLKSANAKLTLENKHLHRELRIIQTNIIQGKYKGSQCEKSLLEMQTRFSNALNNIPPNPNLSPIASTKNYRTILPKPTDIGLAVASSTPIKSNAPVVITFKL